MPHNRWVLKLSYWNPLQVGIFLHTESTIKVSPTYQFIFRIVLLDSFFSDFTPSKSVRWSLFKSALLTSSLIEVAIVLTDLKRSRFIFCKITFMPLLSDNRNVSSISRPSIDRPIPRWFFGGFFVVNTYCPSGHGRRYSPGSQINPRDRGHISIRSFDQ